MALTGVGNAVLRALCEAGQRPQLVVTRREAGSFPYYPEVDIASEAADAGIECLFDGEGEAKIIAERPDLVLVATYHRLLGNRIRESADATINLHPSLLPKYRGPNPFFWVLRNGEKCTGITAHKLTGKMDAGPIYSQHELEIAEDETQGSLRYRLASLAATAALHIVSLHANGSLIGHDQDESAATYFGRPADMDRSLNVEQSLDEALRTIRASTPYPGALVDGKAASKVASIWRGISPRSAVDNSMSFRDGGIVFSTESAQ